MSLIAIVQAIGGDIYDGGRRAVIPGPGHSRHDRSVSLLLSNDRLIIHSFGRSTWREVMSELRTLGLIDTAGRPVGGSGQGWTRDPPMASQERRAIAAALWRDGAPLTRQISLRHVRSRKVDRAPPVSPALRHHGSVPLAVYAARGPRHPALLAAITDPDGELCAVEVTYLDPSGRRACAMSLSRKVIGTLPAACAVRLDPVAAELLVGEGVFTTLSASARLHLPGWALLSTRNLRTWSPPPGVRRVLIAGDRGVEGERSARLLRRRLIQTGLEASVAWPPAPSQDWNEAEEAVRRHREEGRAKEGVPSGRVVRSPAKDTPR